MKKWQIWINKTTETYALITHISDKYVIARVGNCIDLVHVKDKKTFQKKDFVETFEFLKRYGIYRHLNWANFIYLVLLICFIIFLSM